MSVCIMLEISLRICCCTFATRLWLAMQVTRRGAAEVALSACVFLSTNAARPDERPAALEPMLPHVSPAHMRGDCTMRT